MFSFEKTLVLTSFCKEVRFFWGGVGTHGGGDKGLIGGIGAGFATIFGSV